MYFWQIWNFGLFTPSDFSNCFKKARLRPVLWRKPVLPTDELVFSGPPTLPFWCDSLRRSTPAELWLWFGVICSPYDGNHGLVVSGTKESESRSGRCNDKNLSEISDYENCYWVVEDQSELSVSLRTVCGVDCGVRFCVGLQILDLMEGDHQIPEPGRGKMWPHLR